MNEYYEMNIKQIRWTFTQIKVFDYRCFEFLSALGHFFACQIWRCVRDFLVFVGYNSFCTYATVLHNIWQEMEIEI